MQYLTDEELYRYEEVVQCLIDILEIGKRDLTNSKYDGYFISAKKCIKDLQKEQ